MMEGAGPTKRPRTEVEEEGSLSPATYMRGDPWFDDGNVVLVAQGTAFRVFRSILSKNSEIFHDMFAMPQPADAETFEGCPVVHLQDAKHDLEVVIKALFEGSSWYFGHRRTVPFSTVSAWLRLGSKYQIDHLRQDALQRLEECLPPRSFIQFRDSMARMHLRDKNDAIEDMDFIHAIAVVNIAQECSEKQLLPGAFYWCASRLSNRELISGFTDDQGNRWQLSKDDLCKCFDGQQWLRTEALRIETELIDIIPVNQCEHPEACTDVAQDQAHIRRCLPIPTDADPLQVPYWNKHDSMCVYCQERLAELYNRRSDTIWKQLGICFQLGMEWPLPE